MTGERLPRALLLDPVAIPGGAACFADARALGLTSLPILLGWRRAGGSLVVGAIEGVASSALLAATEAVAASTTEWTDARWDSAFRSFWSAADAELREALAERLPLPPGEWTLASWSEAVWGAHPGGVESAALAVLGTSIPDDVREGVLTLGPHLRAAAFTVEPLDESRGRIRCSLVVGELDPSFERSLPGEIDGAVASGRRSGRARVLEEVLPAVERVAADSGARPTWSRRDWVRFEGPRGTVRVFPRGEGVWLQLVGADEGARAGLWFRHGLSPDEGRGAPPDPPPGAHLFLRDAEALTPSVEALLRHWLRGPDVETGAG